MVAKIMLIDILLDRAITAILEARKVREMDEEQIKAYIDNDVDVKRKIEVAKALGKYEGD